MRQIISFIARADLTITVEGWMLHAAYLLGRSFRVLMLPDSHHEGWHPWGGNRNQRRWLFTGDPALDRAPLPEQPRKRAWMALLDRVTGPLLQDWLVELSRSEDPEIRGPAARALVQSGG